MFSVPLPCQPSFVRRASCGALAVALLFGLAACAGSVPLDGGGLGASVENAPRYRSGGPRMPSFSGGNPSELGWVKVDDLLWIEREHVEAYRRGEIFNGVRYVPFESALSGDATADRGFRLRTDHVTVRSNVAWHRAMEMAREAENHVRRFMANFSSPLEVRLPRDPLPVVITASRQEFEQKLRGLVANPVTWGAFYDSRSGVVNVCAEPATQGALPWQADVRHEMTHQILDLARTGRLRGRPFGEGWFWLWEAFAVWSERLGDAPGQNMSQPRFDRFRRRLAWNQWTPLVELFEMSQSQFEGRHYDQTASLMGFLMDGGNSRRRAGMLDIVRRLLRGNLPRRELSRALGVSSEALEREWLTSIGVTRSGR